MTLPSLIAKHEKDVTVSKLKKVYSVMSQALIMSENENGSAENWIDPSATVNEASVTQYFNTYWKPYLKVNKVCKSYAKCGYKALIPWNTPNLTPFHSGIVDPVTRNSFYLNDGTFILLIYIYWDNTDPANPVAQFRKSQDLYIDLNGSKNPNILGKDVFYFSIDLKNHRIIPPSIDSTETGLIDTCKSVGITCSTLIMRNGWKITDQYPW